MGKYRGGMCPAAAPLCSVPHSVCSSVFFLANTTIPKLQEVKENMTMGTTLVTNPDGGFLVRAKVPLSNIYKASYSNVSKAEPLDEDLDSVCSLDLCPLWRQRARPSVFPSEVSCPGNVTGDCKSNAEMHEDVGGCDAHSFFAIRKPNSMNYFICACS